MEQPSSKIYNSLRYDDTAGIVKFHLREQDWEQIKSRGLMWFSSFELFSVQLFNIVEANNANAHTLKVHVHHFFCFKINREMQRLAASVDPMEAKSTFAF